MSDCLIEVASARKLQSDKGDDDLLVRWEGDSILLAVVDGLSMADGRAAATAVVDTLRSLERITDAHSVYQELVSKLPCGIEAPNSATTLTCGVLRTVRSDNSSWLRFDFFAIGDSPVWRVVRLDGEGPYSYQRYVIHGAPYPGEPAKVYATVRPHNREPVRGSVAFGSVDIPLHEVLVLCTDGVPERRLFSREAQRIDAGVEEGRRNFCQWVFGPKQLDNEEALRYLDGFHQQGVLYDDATFIVARLRAPNMETSKSTASVSETARAWQNPAPVSSNVAASQGLAEKATEDWESIALARETHSIDAAAEEAADPALGDPQKATRKRGRVGTSPKRPKRPAPRKRK
jgi:hypothetical protein